jgi:DNA-binding NarL/FixJ family response regulator
MDSPTQRGPEQLHGELAQEAPVLRVLIVEDRPVARLGLFTLLSSQTDLAVVGEASTAVEALHAAAETAPSLVITPLRLGGLFAGIELCRDLKSLPVSPLVIVWTAFTSPQNTAAAFLSGADSIIHQGISLEMLLDSVRATGAGRRVRLVDEQPRSQELPIDRSDLTPREREVLDLILQHATNAEIAAALFVELTTVKSHVRNILRKLEMSSRRELLSDWR